MEGRFDHKRDNLAVPGHAELRRRVLEFVPSSIGLISRVGRQDYCYAFKYCQHSPERQAFDLVAIPKPKSVNNENCLASS
jgi:hypothetical protein